MIIITGGSSNGLTVTAGEVISSGKAVVIATDGKAYVYDISNENHYGKTLGIANQAGTIGNPIEISFNGVAYESGSGWSAGKKYYVSSTGVLTENIPSVGIVKLMGVGIGVDKILITNDFEIITI